MTQDKDYPYSIRVTNESGENYWEWCCTTLRADTWKMMIGIMGAKSSYYFINEEDALAFKLRFNV